MESPGTSGKCCASCAVLKESEIVKKHLMLDHEHMMIAIPPKYAASQVIEFIEDNSAIYLALVYGESKGNFGVQPFLAPRVFSLVFSGSYCPWDGTGDSGYSSE